MSSVDEEYKSLRNKQLQKGVSRTALGRYSTPVLKKRKANEYSKIKKERHNEINSTIFKEIFPPPRLGKSLGEELFCEENKTKNLESDIEEPEFSKNLKENYNQISSFNINNEICQLNNQINSPFSNFKSNSNSAENSPTNFKLKTIKSFDLNWAKSGEDLRRSYIAKLIYKKVWQPTIKEKNHNTLIIFDWDDTLLCTSFLTPNGIFCDDVKISQKDMEKINKLEISSSSILNKAINKGDTYIITNAAPGWVEYSASRFYPEVYKLLKKVTIVSARGEYEKMYPGDSRQWKILAFLEMLKALDTSLVTNLICLGDSIIEMEAAHILASKFSHAYIKTIKFREAPRPDELNKQLNLVLDQFDKIFSSIKNLTIRVEKKSKDEKKQLSGIEG